MLNKTWVEIDQKAYLNNIEQFRKIIVKETKLTAIIKANAYGHGNLEIAQIAAKHIDWFGVDSIDDALAIKKFKKPILILGYTLKDRLQDVVKNNFRQIIYNKDSIIKIGEIAKKIKTKAYLHIKLETGTSRQGVLESDLPKIIVLIKVNPYLILEGLSTHFANIEDTTDHSYAKKQLARFNQLSQTVEKILGQKVPIKHTACSAATILFPNTHFDLIRLGLSSYGLWSSNETRISASERKLKINLKPVLTWKTIVAQVKNLPAGTPISYGLTEKLSRDSKIVILPIGYWDGYDRKLSSVGNVLIQGKRCKILGRICMNMCVCDITHLKNVKPEDEVVLLGRQGQEEISAEELARKIGTINYDVVTRINPLIKRIII